MMTNASSAPAAMAVGANGKACPEAVGQAVTARLGNVRMTGHRSLRLRHVSDTTGDMGVAFGGDQMGHWNVCRVHRILDAMSAPIVRLPIPRENMLAMGRVGDPDMQVVGRYVTRGIAGMPPLTFVSLPDVDRRDTVRTMLIDGHHRIMALALMNASSVPARVFPPELADDVRIVEMGEAIVFPDPDFAMNEIEIGEVAR